MASSRGRRFLLTRPSFPRSRWSDRALLHWSAYALRHEASRACRQLGALGTFLDVVTSCFEAMVPNIEAYVNRNAALTDIRQTLRRTPACERGTCGRSEAKADAAQGHTSSRRPLRAARTLRPLSSRTLEMYQRMEREFEEMTCPGWCMHQPVLMGDIFNARGRAVAWRHTTHHCLWKRMRLSTASVGRLLTSNANCLSRCSHA